MELPRFSSCATRILHFLQLCVVRTVWLVASGLIPSFLTVRSNVYSTSASNRALDIVTIPSLALKFREHPAAELCLQGEKNFQTLLGMGAHRVSPQPKHSGPHRVTVTDLAVQCHHWGGRNRACVDNNTHYPTLQVSKQ